MRQILRGGLRFRGGASFDREEDCLSAVLLLVVMPAGVEYVWA
jgi:hypothetical protein